jgi:hypothetical protein
MKTLSELRREMANALTHGMGILFGISLYYLALFFITFKTTRPTFPMEIHIPQDIPQHSLFWQNHFYIIPIALILFFLSLTYLRLKETEVKS